MTEKVLFVQQYSHMLEQVDDYNNRLEQMENEFREFVDSKIGTDQFYNEVSSMISEMEKQRTLRDRKYKDALDMEKHIKGL